MGSPGHLANFAEHYPKGCKRNVSLMASMNGLSFPETQTGLENVTPAQSLRALKMISFFGSASHQAQAETHGCPTHPELGQGSFDKSHPCGSS